MDGISGRYKKKTIERKDKAQTIDAKKRDLRRIVIYFWGLETGL